MFNLPSSTEINIKLPKNLFDSNKTLAKEVTNKVESIYCINTISPKTLNVGIGKFEEIEVIQLNLKERELNLEVLKHLDEHIPYYVAFILHYENEYRLYIAIKEENKKEELNIKYGYFHTNWLPDVDLSINDNQLDKIYNSYLITASNNSLLANTDIFLQDQTQQAIELNKICKKLETIQKQMSKQPQLNKRIELRKQAQPIEQNIADRLNNIGWQKNNLTEFSQHFTTL